jgi:hypothetical protein
MSEVTTMTGHVPEDQVPKYDRKLLLSAAKRNAVLELWEVQKYGADSYADPDYVSIYGMSPPDWHARGVRLLARTAVECTRDQLGDAIGRDIADVARTAPGDGRTMVVDPFAGSGNTLYWILRHLTNEGGIGFELDPRVHAETRRNLSLLDLRIKVVLGDFAAGLASQSLSPDQLLVVFVAPPWGDALDPISGLDLRRTAPPIAEVIDTISQSHGRHRLLYAVQIHERLEPNSLAEVSDRFDWSTVRHYGFNAPGENHGVLLGTRGWKP